MPTTLVLRYTGTVHDRFDRGYYLTKHMPAVAREWTPLGLLSARAFFPAQDAGTSGTVCICECVFKDEAAAHAAFAAPGAKELVADIANFTGLPMTPAILSPFPGADTELSGAEASSAGTLSLRELSLRRRSVRQYTGKPIPRETLNAMLETALLAPTSWGRKVVEFVVVEERKTLAALARCKSIGAPPVAAAAAAVVVIADTEHAELWIEDASVAAAHLLLAAEEQGLGACWNHIRNRAGQKGTAEEEIRELLGIPENYAVLCVVALGYKDEKKSPRTEEDIPKNNIHYDAF